ncbi:hypothetical protein VD0004_g4720 [Verticillium dahliae]|nr:hypothetical protein VD0004_g4720 [Verticillium dahliae]PNH72973.1 hypothetical protein VD0001_g4556 [Verticillium dahliae]RBQ65397.1 hypothetical protein VDGD_02863 [Verticillium dahliae]
MAPTSNKSFIYKKAPQGFPVPGEDLVIEDRPIDLENAPLHGGVLVEVLYTSFDPYMRGRMRDPKIKSYSPPFDLDQPIVSASVVKVLRSDTPEFAVGDELVSFYGQNAQYAVIPAPAFKPMGLRKVHNPHNLPVHYFIGVLGMPGTTAYEGLYEIGKPVAGETIFVSSAAGAVGQLVGQLAKAEGLKVIGSAGSQEKIDFITNELGFDGAFNYKTEDANEALARLAPNGIDIYFDNVGGAQLEAALHAINKHGRIIACGSIVDYNVKPEDRYGVKNLFNIIGKSLTFKGFIVSLTPERYQAFNDKVQPLLADGKIKAKVDVTEGIENAPEGLVGIFHGKNFGKAILKVKA